MSDRSRLVRGSLAALLVLLLTPGDARCAWPTLEGSPLTVAYSGSMQWGHQSVMDGAGGVFVGWQEYRDGSYTPDTYVKRIDAAGVAAAGWPARGIGPFPGGGGTDDVSLAADGAGGVFVAANRYYGAAANVVVVHHLLADGTPAPGWPVDLPQLGDPPNGSVPACAMVADGAGGVYVAATSEALVATLVHLGASGSAATGWPFNGVVLTSQAVNVQLPDLAIAPGGLYACVNTASGLSIQRWPSSGSPAPDWSLETMGSSPTFRPLIRADAAGGVIAAWDMGGIVVQRLTETGAPAEGWSPIPVPAGPAGDSSYWPYLSLALEVTADRILVAWSPSNPGTGWDVLAQLIDLSGGVLGPAGGIPIAVDSNDQRAISMTEDPGGGFFISWTNWTFGLPTRVFAQHLEPDGSVSPGWPAGGRTVPSSSVVSNSRPILTVIGGNGACLAWRSSRIYAHRIDRYNFVGDPVAPLTGVDDVTGDQGGIVRVSWAPSYLDVASWQRVGAYHVERLAGALQTAGAAGATWERIVTVAPDGSDTYQLDVATAGGASNVENQFRIVTDSIDGPTFGTWTSDVLAGTALDNLPPDEPANFGGVLTSGMLELSWDASPAPDLADYALYRGDDPFFTPDAAHLVVETSATSEVLSAAGGSYFKLAARDVNGNASTYAAFDASALVDVGPAQAALALRGMIPNPAAGPARIAWSLPQAMAVDLAVFDVAGRRVRTLASGQLESGPHVTDWRLTDDDGRRLTSGLYFLRLTVPGHSLARRIVVTD